MIKSNAFEILFLVLIGINTLSLALIWNYQDDKLIQVIELINRVFTGIFGLEAVLKIIGLGSKYFRDISNVFDFVIAIGSIVGTILEGILHVKGASFLNVIRIFRIGRIFKFFKNN